MLQSVAITAGVGKTHLFCDVAARRVRDGHPTVLLLGQEFDQRSLLPQIGESSELGGTLNDVLAVLDAASEAAGCLGLFMIDALNESTDPERWPDDVRALAEATARYPHIALVLSCRTEFVPTVLGKHPFAAVNHVGFAEATDVAVNRFARAFGLEPPTFPALNPEFSNPLYLKLTCESLTTLGAQRFSFGAAGLTTVSAAFLEAVNKRLSAAGRCDYDERSNPVATVVQQLAQLGSALMDRDEVRRIAEDTLPRPTWSRSLMRGLIAEGVLLEVGNDRIAFGYQRLGDVARANAIADEKTPDALRSWLSDLRGKTWRERGVLDALAVIIPERYEQLELADLAAQDGAVPADFVDGFIESLSLRSAASVSARTIEIVLRLLASGYNAEQVWDRLVRIACVPGHPLNAEWLHTHLAGYDVAERDRTWSEWLVEATDPREEKAVHRLIEWAWPRDQEHRPTAIPGQVAALATLVLGWLLTARDRAVRDKATKALVSVADQSPGAFAETLERFRGTNDPYVLERLAAAACAAVLRSDDPQAVRQIADGVRALISDQQPKHQLTRDYVRRVFERARSVGWSGPSAPSQPGGQWPLPTRPIEEIEQLAGPPDYHYGSIWHSLTGHGDFGRYVLQPALEHLDRRLPTALKHDAERAVFERVLDLGWTPERFAEIDTRHIGGRDSTIERVGKKYQWIGLYEVLGQLVDHHRIADDTEQRPAGSIEQIVWRDIDPTLLVRKPPLPPPAGQRWFSPVDATFEPNASTDYPADMAGVPDPMDLIAVSDPTGAPWLALASHPSWEQPLPPEIDAKRVPRRGVWMHLDSYLVATGQVDALRQRIEGIDTFGRWLPAIAEPSNLLLGSFPHDPQWSAADGPIDWADVQAHGPQPETLLHTAAWYAGTGSSRDASAENQTLGLVPTRRLAELLGLSRGVDFAWHDRAGLAVQDASVTVGGPPVLAIRRDLASKLADAGLTIFWTVRADNELHQNDHTSPGDDYRWVSASASYVLRGERLEQLGSNAARCMPGPATEHELAWVTKKTES